MTDIRETMRPDRNVKPPLANQIAGTRDITARSLAARDVAAFDYSSGADKAFRANDPDRELLGQTEDFSARSTPVHSESKVAQGTNFRAPLTPAPVAAVEDPYASVVFTPSTTGPQPGLDIVGAIAAAFVILGPLFLGAISRIHG